MANKPSYYYFLVAKIKKLHVVNAYKALFHDLFDGQAGLIEVKIQPGIGENLTLYGVTAAAMIDPSNMDTFNTKIFSAEDATLVETWTNCPDLRLIGEVGGDVTVQPGFVFAGYLRCKPSIMDFFQTSKREIVCSQLEELLRGIEDEGIYGAIWYPNLKQKTLRFHIESKTPITDLHREKLMSILNQEGVADLIIFEN